ncbi:MAG: endonuclease MutS2, partial [Myxococcota bacterium]
MPGHPMGFEVSERVLEMLDWGAVEAALAEETVSPEGRRLALARDWADDAEVPERLAEVTEARALLAAGRNPLHPGMQEIAPHLAQAAKGKVLGGLELLRIGETLRAARMTRTALQGSRDAAPRLAALGDALPDLSDLEQMLLRSFDHAGHLCDDASPALCDARREVAQLTTKIQKRITAALASSALAPHLQDHFYTLRADRYVLPIKIESRGRVPGIVHDVSASGTTVFVEPGDIVDLNNRLRFAERAEERESIRILTALGARVGENIEAVGLSLDVLGRIDRIIAGARLSDRLAAHPPEVSPRPMLALRLARHPLLALRDDPVVSNDIAVGADYDGLILTGPNAGGKTVALKTAGLAVLLTRAGLHVPAEPGSTVGLFRRLHADIGDDQNIAESLSTFSGQIAQIVRFLDLSDAGTLVLIDEIIVGTDPAEGGVLAQ